MMSDVLAPERFIAVFARQFGRAPEDVSLVARLDEDLAFDSLELFRTVLFVEELADVVLPDDVLPEFVVVEDVYRYYTAKRRSVVADG